MLDPVLFLECKEEFDGLLRDRMIPNNVRFEVYDYKDNYHPTSLGFYSHKSQFKGRPCVVIQGRMEDFVAKWLKNKKKRGGLPLDLDLRSGLKMTIVDTMLHEYGHIIAEYGRFKNRKITNIIHKKIGCSEEEFAEWFIDYCRKGVIFGDENDDYYRKAIVYYSKS